MSRKIVVIGSLNLDLVAKVARMPAEGETLTGLGFATYPGGKGANQAVAAALLGGDVVMVGRVGKDGFGEQLRGALHGAGVDTSCVREVAGSSGTAVILVTPFGGNSIVVIPGANGTISPQELELHAEVIEGASIVLAQLEVPLETVVRAAELAAARGVPFVLDPAPAQGLPPEFLKNVTWLTPNETETMILLQSLGHEWNGNLEDEAGIAEAAVKLLATGVRNVILKLSGRGVYLRGVDVVGHFVDAAKVQVVDTTAAGDTFNGAFAYALTEGAEPSDAARFACFAAAISVTRPGAQPSMPHLEEVRALIQAIGPPDGDVLREFPVQLVQDEG
jgi:ribokinase